jgi:hypothetical protein
MGVAIGSSGSVWHQWFLLRVSTNLPDSFKFPIALFSYCLIVMMLMIESYWTYASYCVIIHIFLKQTRLHNTYKRTPNACFHYWVVSHSLVSFSLVLILISFSQFTVITGRFRLYRVSYYTTILFSHRSRAVMNTSLGQFLHNSGRFDPI